MDHPHPAGPARRRLAILAAVCLAALALPLSFSGGAVATPAIGRDLGGSAVALRWITNAFMLTFGSLLMAAGTLADRYGRKRLFALGTAGFALSSLALGLAPSLWAVDLLRAAQGVAAAAALAGGRRNSTARRAHVPSACSAPPSASAWPSARCWPAG